MKMKARRLIGMWMLCMVVYAVSAAVLCDAQRTRPARKSGTALPTKPTPADGQIRYKGIFEPVNYPDDLDLHSVFFASENEGWIAAAHGTILHTSDGGKNWQPQVGGDPASAEAAVGNLYFLDRRHGWAVQSHNLLHTSDGQHWTRTGAFPNGGQVDYAFTSDSTGFYIVGFAESTLQRTTDGGKTWKPVANCAAKMQIQGLMKNVGCHLATIAFPTANVGYVFGVGADSLFALKTTDGGATWAVSVVPDMVPGNETRFNSFFSDEKHGFVALHDGKLLVTTDGGQSWNAVAGVRVLAPIRFADPQVGWSLGGYYSDWSFTADGGANWNTRNLRFPTAVTGFSFPKRDVGYVVGNHGMVYRYHIVPEDYKVANGIDAPAMPGSNVALNSQLQRIKTDVAALQVKLGAAGGSMSAGALTSSAASTSASSGTAAGTAISAQPADNSATAGMAIPAQPADSAGMASSSDTGMGMAAGAATPTDTGVSASGGDAFTQDAAFTPDTSGPPSPVIQSCCAADIGKLQGEVNSFMQQVPAASGQFRNLNLVIAGARMVSDLFTKAKGFKDAFVNLKKSPNMQSASAALQDLVSKLDGVGQTLSSGFQNPPPLPDLGGGFSGAAGVAGQAFSATPSDSSAAGASATGAAPDASANNDPKKTATQDKVKEVQDKIKKKLKLPF